MNELVALAIAPSRKYRETIERVWENGDAFFPLDMRLSPQAQQQQLQVARPTKIIESDGELRTLPRGSGVEEGDAYVVLTSGTTGDPKGVIHTFDSMRASCLGTNEALQITTSDGWICGLPPSHVGGLSVITRSILTGLPLHIMEGFPEHEVNQARANGANLISIVRAVISRLDLTTFKAVLLGAQSPPDNLPANYVTTYGMTETGSGVVYNNRPLKGVNIECSSDGEILIQAPMLARSYRDGQPLLDNKGWYHTGDVGLVEDSGEIRILGRASEVINSGGEKLYPNKIEDLLLELPGVCDVAVVGVEHAKWGEEVVAVVVLEDGMGASFDLNAVRDIVSIQLAPWAVPKRIYSAEAIPKTALGKVRRGMVRQSLSSFRLLT